nr:MAG TPA: hypothetical protein [Caudoviricetes sp.]
MARRRPGTSDPYHLPANDPAMGSRLIFFFASITCPILKTLL